MNNNTNKISCVVEKLETRKLMSAAQTEMADLAAQAGEHAGTTELFLNFDGGDIDDPQSGGVRHMTAFQPSAFVNRDQMIQDIAYRVAEMFSPFNVRVRILTGAGNFAKSGGATTVFIGDNADLTKNGSNGTGSLTPAVSSDFPCKARGFGHVLNSDAYDLAFVDPMWGFGETATGSDDAAIIAGTVAHEAGHTFGLAHVLAGADPDMMNYSPEGSHGMFKNTSYMLTNENGMGTSNELLPATASDKPMLTQNSYLTLRNALAPAGIFFDPYMPFVADSSTISSDYNAMIGSPMTLTPASTRSSRLYMMGDYDVYTFNNVSSSSRLNIATTAFASGDTQVMLAQGNVKFDPQMLLYSSDGKTLLAAVHGSTMTYKMGNTSYKLVVGGFGGNSAGNYTLTFGKASPVVLGSTTTTTTGGPKTSTTSFSTTRLVDSFILA